MDSDEKRIEEIKAIKRNCLLCNARHSLNPEMEKEKNLVMEKLQELKNAYDELFNELRQKNKETEKIKQALENRRGCMDALDLCKKCSRDIDKVNRFLSIQ